MVGVEVVVEVGVEVGVEVVVVVGVEGVVVVGVGVVVVVEVGVEVEVVVGVEVVIKNKLNNNMSKTLEISDETYEKIKTQLNADELVDISNLDDLVGQKLFIRTVTYHLVGKVKKRMGAFIQLGDASWVADSGRFMNAIKEGALKEVEPVGIAWVNLSSVVDFFPWRHSLPKDQK